MSGLIFLFYKFLYGPLFIVTIIAMPVAGYAWGCLGKRVERKLWRRINVAMIVVVVLVILAATMMIRMDGAGTGVRGDLQPIPFHTLIDKNLSPEVYRVAFGNILIFIPLGAVVASLIMTGRTESVATFTDGVLLKTVLIGLLFSLGIEVIQYLLAMGQADVDDVICNTLGTLIGCISVVIGKRNKKWEN